MLTLFFVDDLPTVVGSNYEFSGDDALHAIKVLRTQVGERFNLSDGKGSWSTVIATDVAKKSMIVQVEESGYQGPLEVQFTVIQAIPKGDRIKESIELCTAGGADRIVMWQAARSIGKVDEKLDKLQTTAREASKQTRRFSIPVIDGVSATDDVAAFIKSQDLALIFHQDATEQLSTIAKPGPKSVAIIIGPEGGLTNDEVAIFQAAGAQVAVMGRPVLRSAHAGLAALSAVNTALTVW